MIARQPGSGCPTKLSNLVLQIVNEQMRLNDETTAVQLHDILTGHGISISLRTVLRSREQLGWTFRGSAYCQLIQLYVMLIKLKGWSGLSSTLMMTLRM